MRRPNRFQLLAGALCLFQLGLLWRNGSGHHAGATLRVSTFFVLLGIVLAIGFVVSPWRARDADQPLPERRRVARRFQWIVWAALAWTYVPIVRAALTTGWMPPTDTGSARVAAFVALGALWTAAIVRGGAMDDAAARAAVRGTWPAMGAFACALFAATCAFGAGRIVWSVSWGGSWHAWRVGAVAALPSAVAAAAWVVGALVLRKRARRAASTDVRM